MSSVSDLTASKAWFHKARLGAFIHWGLYALPGGMWEGTSVPYLAEWLQSARRIPNAEYSLLAERFNPQTFDADAIVKGFSDAGLRSATASFELRLAQIRDLPECAISSSPPSTTRASRCGAVA